MLAGDVWLHLFTLVPYCFSADVKVPNVGVPAEMSYLLPLEEPLPVPPLPRPPPPRPSRLGPSSRFL